ncbi:hypothetical protein [Microbacterium sp. SORGH_AS_0888]|uniref:hypothetical protein n=1 Tax=Microbacterium sp. SORGH_AS_0888 TaxID=3041791 RepID=UPI00278AD957|nr:hypothetical protein [Microbacterium sp. SORGH_AS_0888]MDQ1130096.1 hypothetical protein [Microbacterium sp. SORGH_AS_0888]
MLSRRRPRARFYISAFLVGALVGGMPLAADAYWRATSTAPSFSASTASLPVPSVSCSSQPGLLGLTPYARISWTTNAAAASYTLIASNDANPPVVISRELSGPPFEMRGSLLSALAGTFHVTVVAHYGTWTSAPSNSVAVVQSDPLLGFLVGGAKCA